MKPILEMNAFDPQSVDGLAESLQQQLRRRATLLGAASVLFYDRPLEFVRGAGCWLYDVDGAAYLDAYNNVQSVGHCHPVVVAAAARQLQSLNVHNRYLHRGILEYAEALLATLPAALSNVTFTCTGSESNDLAVRMAACFTGGTGVIVTRAAYHGNTALLTDLSPSSFAHRALPPHVRTVPPPDSSLSGSAVGAAFAANVAAAIADLEQHGFRFAALLLDTVFSSDGIFPGPLGFLQAAVEVVHERGGLFLADEVQPGFGRLGTSMWGFERHGVLPDLVTLGKPMGNGYPIGAVITRPAILDAFCRHVGYFNTFGGSPVAAAVGMAVLAVINSESLLANAARTGAYLTRQLTAMSARHLCIRQVRGAGLYLGIELTDRSDGTPAGALANAVVNGMRNRQVLIGTAGQSGHVLKIRPPLCFSTADADTLVGALNATLEEVARPG